MNGPTARLDWSLRVDCPHCNERFDVVDFDSENDNVIATKIFNNQWDDVAGCEVTCPKCEHEFAIGKVEY